MNRLILIISLLCITHNASAGRLHRAVGQNDIDQVRALLADGAIDVDKEDGGGITPLSWAVYYGQDGVEKLLLEHHADVDKKDRNGNTPLFVAAYEGHDAVVKLLLDHHADVDKEDNDGETPLNWAVREGKKASSDEKKKQYQDIIELLKAQRGKRVKFAGKRR